MEGFLLNNLDKVGRFGVKAASIALADVPPPEKKVLKVSFSVMETEAKARAELRYQQVLANANGQYNSAVSKYSSGVADYQAQKAAAEKQLAESLAQLDAAEAALETMCAAPVTFAKVSG